MPTSNTIEPLEQPQSRFTRLDLGGGGSGKAQGPTIASTLAELFLCLRNDPTTRAAAERILKQIEERDRLRYNIAPPCEKCGCNNPQHQKARVQPEEGGK